MKKKKAKTQAGFAAAVETGSSFFALAFVRIKIKSLTSMPDLILVFQLSQRTLMHIRSVARTARVRFLSDKFCYCAISLTTARQFRKRCGRTAAGGCHQLGRSARHLELLPRSAFAVK
jgi:hypothetical protein